MFSFCFLRNKSYGGGGTKTDTEEKYKTKIEKQKQRLICADQSKLIGTAPPKKKHTFYFMMDS